MRYSRFVPVCLVLSVATALSAQTPTFSAPKQIPSNIPTSWTSAVVYTGNFNGNGNTDLDISVGPNSVPPEFLSGDGAGAFTQTGPVAPYFALQYSLVGDFNGDGKDDFVTLTPACPTAPCGNWPQDQSNTDGIFSVSPGQGNGGFGEGFIDTLPARDNVVEGLVADFNKDGKPDVAVLAVPGSIYTANAHLAIFLNQGNGTFSQTDYALPLELSSGEPLATNLVAGDFEGNGNLDLAFAYASAYGTPTAHAELLTFAGDGKGDFGPAVISYVFNSAINYAMQYDTFFYGTQHASLFASDLNGDGRTDLLISLAPATPTGNASAVTLLADSQGRFHWGSSVAMDPSVQSVVLTDVNGDGHPDLIFIGNKTSSSGASSEYAGIYLGTATGAFQTPHIPLSVPGTGPQPSIIAVPLKTGALPSIFVSGAKSVALMYINRTK
jgi:hypothetical protein